MHIKNIFFTSLYLSWPDLVSPYSKLWSKFQKNHVIDSFLYMQKHYMFFIFNQYHHHTHHQHDSPPPDKCPPPPRQVCQPETLVEHSGQTSAVEKKPFSMSTKSPQWSTFLPSGCSSVLSRAMALASFSLPYLGRSVPPLCSQATSTVQRLAFNPQGHPQWMFQIISAYLTKSNSLKPVVHPSVRSSVRSSVRPFVRQNHLWALRRS